MTSCGEVLQALKQKHAALVTRPGVFFGWIEDSVVSQVPGCVVALKAQPASAVSRHTVLLPVAWKLLLHQH